MGWDLTGLGSVADLAKGLIDRFFPPDLDPAEKARIEAEMRQALERREAALLEAQKSVMVAELQQGDSYTKRARPTVIYAGLLFIFLVHVIGPLASAFAGLQVPSLSLPTEFWWAWSGICGAYVLGRTAEKRGGPNQVTKLLTGK